jgi:hypothetical protein
LPSRFDSNESRLQNKTTNEDRRKERQRELAQAINQAARDRLAEQTGSRNDKT